MPSNTQNMTVGFEGYVKIDNVEYDVSKWFFQILHIQANVTHSGCQGQITRKPVAQDWNGGFESPYFDNVNMLAALKQGKEIRVKFIDSDGSVYEGLGVCDSQAVVSDSTGTDVVRISVRLSGAGPLDNTVSISTDPLKFTSGV